MNKTRTAQEKNITLTKRIIFSSSTVSVTDRRTDYQLEEKPRNCYSPACSLHEFATRKHTYEWDQTSGQGNRFKLHYHQLHFSRNASRIEQTHTHHGAALGGEPREATGLDVGPAPSEDEAHGAHQALPPPSKAQDWLQTPKPHAATNLAVNLRHR